MLAIVMFSSSVILGGPEHTWHIASPET